MATTLKIKKPAPTIVAKPVIKPASGDEAPAPAEGEGAPAQEGGGGIYVSKRHQLQQGDAGSSRGGGSFGWAAVLASLAAVLWIAVLVLEYMDWTQLKIA